MNDPLPIPSGLIASLHLHPPVAGDRMQTVPSFEAVRDKGIAGNPRYFERATRRQVTLIEREQLADHAAALGLPGLPPGAARANIETTGIRLADWIGRDIQVGGAVLHLYEFRQPCAKMDAVARGLRALMGSNRQGVLATVVQSGTVRVGDTIHLVKTASPV